MVTGSIVSIAKGELSLTLDVDLVIALTEQDCQKIE